MMNNLTPLQAEFCQTYLKKIFVDEVQQVDSLNESQKQAIAFMVQSHSEPEMKSRILSPLSNELLSAILAQLPSAEQLNFFTYFKYPTRLTQIYQTLPSEQKKRIMSYLYQRHPSLYDKLKSAMAPQTTVKEGLYIKPHAPLAYEEDRLLNVILDMIQDTDIPLKKIILYRQQMESQFQVSALSSLTDKLISAFQSLKSNPLTPTGFKEHLKFHHFIAPLLVIFPQCVKPIFPIIDQLILAIPQFPTKTAQYKVLNQLSVSTLGFIIDRLEMHTTLRKFEMRSIYSKLLQQIHRDLPTLSNTNLQKAMANR